MCGRIHLFSIKPHIRDSGKKVHIDINVCKYVFPQSRIKSCLEHCEV